MPMDPGYEELEKDIVEKRGAGRVWQEMAKNPALPGSGVSTPHPNGIPPEQMAAKVEKTRKAIEADSTQVLRREQQGR